MATGIGREVKGTVVVGVMSHSFLYQVSVFRGRVNDMHSVENDRGIDLAHLGGHPVTRFATQDLALRTGVLRQFSKSC